MKNPIPKTEREVFLSKFWAEQGLEHSKPSPETMKVISDLSSKLDVLVEHVKNGFEKQETNYNANKEDHLGIMKRQDHTNGNVTALQRWKAYLIGAWAVISFTYPILGYYYVQNLKHEITEINQANMKQIAHDEAVTLLERNFDDVKK